ncbi:MAG: PP2C family protein-serine/threonine phosphatase [Bacteroidales bacterium]|nr:PP2C family protein-serine/threonine phosphatase [Bacteroidales bacterium]MDD7725122.1 PP2C family protein-serine/threonine phosphatase [Bacteroidales bacterium]MDY4174003.1 PP2C family protein-serine/threonine phosphatase [Bacteroidales bacterium]
MANDRNVVRLYKEKMNLLLDVAQTVNEDSSVEDLMAEFETLLKDQLGVGKILVFTLDSGRWRCLLKSNVSDVQRDAIDIARDLMSVKTVTSLGMVDTPSLNCFDAIIPLSHNHKVMGYVLVGDTEEADGISPTIRHLKFIQILANIIIVFIENKKMHARLLKQERLRQELALASRIQSSLIPNSEQLHQSRSTKALSYYHPHDEVGGDYFDVLPLDSHNVGFCIADVSGKGIAAALLMSNFQSMIRSLFTARVNLKHLINDLNARVSQNAAGEKFITCFIGRYNNITGRLTYVNAGHQPPVVKSGDKMYELNAGCMGLGMLEDLPGVEVGKTKLSKGDIIVAYTDGLVEVNNGGTVGTHLPEVLKIIRSATDVEPLMDNLSLLAEKTRSNDMTFDDTSILALEVTRSPLLPF